MCPNICGFSSGSGGVRPQCRRPWFDPWVWKIPWRREWQLTPVFCLENPTDRRALQAIVHRVSQSRTQMKRLSPAHTHKYLWLGVEGKLRKKVWFFWFCFLNLPILFSSLQTLETDILFQGFPGGTSGEEYACQSRRRKRCEFDP